MIITLLLNLIVMVLGAIFIWLPQVDRLPKIVGVDVDTALINGVSQVRFVAEHFWVIGIVFEGLLFLLVYYILKMVLRFFLGSRSV